MNVELLPALAVIAGGFAAGCINVIAAGGSLITIPLLIVIGIPATSANGTVRLAILVQGLTATWRFHSEGAVDWAQVRRLVLPVWIGAAAGVLVAVNMADTDFKALIGWVTLFAGGVVAIDFKGFLANREVSETAGNPIWLALGLFAAGFYGGLAQAGVGYLFLAALVIAGGLELVQANVLKVVLIMAFTPLAIAVFGFNAKIHLEYALLLAVGQALGAYVGAGLTLDRGAALIRPVLAAVVVAAAIKLIFF